jgi:branched-chain amino acid transport system substrate-binding protein
MRFAPLCACLVLGAGTAVAEAPEPPVSDGVVRIGLILDMTGVYSYLAGEGNLAAARMAVEDFGGEVLGHPIEIVHADHRNRSYAAAAQARDWFATGGVDALMDVAGSSPALAVARVAAQMNRVAVFNTAAARRLTNESCTPVTAHWTFDSYALAQAAGREIVKAGGDSWYFVTADYTAGHSLERDAAAVVRAEGGKVLGSSMHALGVADWSSHLLRAQESGAKVIGLATFGAELIGAIKAARDLGVTAPGKQRLVALLAYIDDIHTLGLEATQGLVLTSAFYSDLNDETRAWSRRFHERQHKMPNMLQAGVYSATMHYLKAVQAAGTDRTEAVMSKMRGSPVDFFGQSGTLREDGRMVHDMYLFEVKQPGESSAPWDYYKLRATIPGEQAFQPLATSLCRLVKK